MIKASKLGWLLPKAFARYKRSPLFYITIVEKLPLFILCGVTVYLSSSSQHAQSAIVSFESTPMMLRIENAMVSYVVYIIKMFFPIHLAVFYPFPDSIPPWRSVTAFMILLIITAFAIKNNKQHLYFLMGWLWYLGTLVPVIGLIQAGLWPAMADRFTYIPLIGLFIVIAWGSSEILTHWRHRGTILASSSAIILVVLIVASHAHVMHWRSDVVLFERTIAVTEPNPVAQNNLGLAYMNQNDYEKAFKHISEAIRLSPGHALAHNNMGYLLFKKGQIDKAIRYYKNAVHLKPNFKKAHANLAAALAAENRMAEAIDYYKSAVSIDANYSEAHLNLGKLLAERGRFKEAIKHLKTVLKINGGYRAQAYYNLGNIFRNKGQFDEAISHYLKALRIKPDFGEAHNNLGIAYAETGNIGKALNHFEKALQTNPANDAFRNNLKNVQVDYKHK